MAEYGSDPKRPRWIYIYIYLIFLKTQKVFLSWSSQEVWNHLAFPIIEHPQGWAAELGWKAMKLCVWRKWQQPHHPEYYTKQLRLDFWILFYITYYLCDEWKEDHGLYDSPISLRASRSSSSHSRPLNPALMRKQNLRKMEVYKGGQKDRNRI